MPEIMKSVRGVSILSETHTTKMILNTRRRKEFRMADNFTNRFRIKQQKEKNRPEYS